MKTSNAFLSLAVAAVAVLSGFVAFNAIYTSDVKADVLAGASCPEVYADRAYSEGSKVLYKGVTYTCAAGSTWICSNYRPDGNTWTGANGGASAASWVMYHWLPGQACSSNPVSTGTVQGDLTVTGDVKADNNTWGATSPAVITSEVEGLKTLTCPAGTYLMNLVYTTSTATNDIVSIEGGHCAKL